MQHAKPVKGFYDVCKEMRILRLDFGGKFCAELSPHRQMYFIFGFPLSTSCFLQEVAYGGAAVAFALHTLEGEFAEVVSGMGSCPGSKEGAYVC